MIAKFEEHGIHYMHMAYIVCHAHTNDIINLLPWQLRVHIDVKEVSSRCQSAKVLSTAISNFISAMETDLLRPLTYNS